MAKKPDENGLRTLALRMIEDHGTWITRSLDFDQHANEMCRHTFGLDYELGEGERECVWDLINKATVTLPYYMDPRV